MNKPLSSACTLRGLSPVSGKVWILSVPNSQTLLVIPVIFLDIWSLFCTHSNSGSRLYICFVLIAMFVWLCVGGLMGSHADKSIFSNSALRYCNFWRRKQEKNQKSLRASSFMKWVIIYYKKNSCSGLYLHCFWLKFCIFSIFSRVEVWPEATILLFSLLSRHCTERASIFFTFEH